MQHKKENNRMGMLKEFKDFAMKGNVVDMAVGFILGGAFSTVVKSLVNDIMMPPLGYLMGKVDFSTMSIKLKTDAEPVLIKYGMFINSVISFLIVGFALFMIIRAMNKVQAQFEGKKEDEAPTTKKCGECLMDIPIEAKKCGFCTSQV